MQPLLHLPKCAQTAHTNHMPWLRCHRTCAPSSKCTLVYSRRCQVRQRRQDGAAAPQTRCRSRRTSCSYGCRVAAVSLQGTQVIKSSRPHRGCSVCSRRQGSISRQRQPLRPTAPSSRRSHAANPTPRVRAYPLTAQSCEAHRPMEPLHCGLFIVRSVLAPLWHGTALPCKGTSPQVACTETLYKVFERC
jgi:hypothetical protein